jgi:hypothetical protein
MQALLAYDVDGNVVATLDHMVARDESGNVVGLIDFEAHENAGGKHRDIWEVADAAGSGCWPEWLGNRAHDFRVELEAGRIVALVHKRNGRRRERAAIEAAIAAVPEVDGARDIRHLVGGPMRPLPLSTTGKTMPTIPNVTPGHLPIAGVRHG